MEENYIWTDNEKFFNNINNIFSDKNEINYDKIRQILQDYYDTVKSTIQNDIPKLIMYNIISNIIKNISKILLKNTFENDINKYMEEEGVNNKRKN